MALELENLWIFAPSVPGWVILSKSLNIHELVLLSLKWDHNAFHSAFVLCFFFSCITHNNWYMVGIQVIVPPSFLYWYSQTHTWVRYLINTFHQTLSLPQRIYLPCILSLLPLYYDQWVSEDSSIHPSIIITTSSNDNRSNNSALFFCLVCFFPSLLHFLFTGGNTVDLIGQRWCHNDLWLFWLKSLFGKASQLHFLPGI